MFSHLGRKTMSTYSATVAIPSVGNAGQERRDKFLVLGVARERIAALLSESTSVVSEVESDECGDLLSIAFTEPLVTYLARPGSAWSGIIWFVEKILDGGIAAVFEEIWQAIFGKSGFDIRAEIKKVIKDIVREEIKRAKLTTVQESLQGLADTQRLYASAPDQLGGLLDQMTLAANTLYRQAEGLGVRGSVVLGLAASLRVWVCREQAIRTRSEEVWRSMQQFATELQSIVPVQTKELSRFIGKRFGDVQSRPASGPGRASEKDLDDRYFMYKRDGQVIGRFASKRSAEADRKARLASAIQSGIEEIIVPLEHTASALAQLRNQRPAWL